VNIALKKVIGKIIDRTITRKNQLLFEKRILNNARMNPTNEITPTRPKSYKYSSRSLCAAKPPLSAITAALPLPKKNSK